MNLFITDTQHFKKYRVLALCVVISHNNTWLFHSVVNVQVTPVHQSVLNFFDCAFDESDNEQEICTIHLH